MGLVSEGFGYSDDDINRAGVAAFPTPVDRVTGPITEYRGAPTDQPAGGGIFQSPFGPAQGMNDRGAGVGGELAPPAGAGVTPDVRVSVSPPATRGLGDRGIGDAGPLPLGGPLETAVSAAPVASSVATISNGTRSATYTADQVANTLPAGDISAYDKMMGDYSRMKTQEGFDAAQAHQNVRDHDTDAIKAGRQIQAGLDAKTAAWEATVAKAQARGGVFGGDRKQAAAAVERSVAAKTRADQLSDVARNPVVTPQRNAIEEFARGQGVVNANEEARQRGAGTAQGLKTGAVELEGKKIGIAGAKLDLAGKQRLNDLGTKLTTTTDPKEAALVHSQILALLGKDKPEEYHITHAPGATRADANGVVTKDPDSVYVINKRTGAAELLGGGQTQAPKPPDGFVGRDAKGKLFKMVNGKPEPYGG